MSWHDPGHGLLRGRRGERTKSPRAFGGRRAQAIPVLWVEGGYKLARSLSINPHEHVQNYNDIPQFLETLPYIVDTVSMIRINGHAPRVDRGRSFTA